jgi:hypothetical protein
MNLVLLLMTACAPEGADSAPFADDAVDLRLQDGDYEVPAGAEVWWGPEVRIEPGEDKMFCLFGTYNGDDVGVQSLTTWQNAFGHHVVLMGTTASELDYPDGTVVDCTQSGSVNMADMEPIMYPTGAYAGGEFIGNQAEVPVGMAMKLDAGQRYVLQAHYINTGTEPIVAKDVAVVGFLAEEEVETWAAPLALNHGNFSVPPGESLTVSFDCNLGTEWNVLYTLGHMHEWGTSIKLEQVVGDTVTTIFDIPEWKPEYRDAPPVNRYAEGEYVLPADATLRTTCSWFNDTDTPLEFPHEMCVATGVVYPQYTPVICDAE